MSGLKHNPIFRKRVGAKKYSVPDPVPKHTRIREVFVMGAMRIVIGSKLQSAPRVVSR